MSTQHNTPIEIPYFIDPEQLFSQIRELPYSCWLDSGKPHSHSGRYDIMTAAPKQRLETNGKTTKIYQLRGHFLNDDSEQLISSSEQSPWQIVQTALSSMSQHCIHQHIPFSGGALGYFGYDLGKINTTKERPNECQLADMHIGIYQWAIIQDHHRQKGYLSWLPECNSEAIKEVHCKILELAGRNQEKSKKPLTIEPLVANTTHAEYTNKLQHIDKYIHAGDCYQVNFAQRFHAQYKGDPYTAYVKLRKTMASPYSAFLSIKEKAILSLSPERLIKIDQQQALTQPIKGTAPRHADPDTDKQYAKELQASSKNRAENLMIVDLLRNDFGKNCIPGSIKVPELFTLESYPNVHHLVSSITGQIENDKHAIDLLRGCFPGGSITGAPKKRAMEIIDELEHSRRSIYCGSIAYINAQGDMDSNITIRTIACDGESLYCWGGGGIVADSDIDDEYQESLTKINALLATLAEFNVK